MADKLYLKELQLDKANISTMEASFLDVLG